MLACPALFRQQERRTQPQPALWQIHGLRHVSVAAALFAGLWSTAANAQVPAISTVAPGALKPGAATDIKVRGGNLAGSTGLLTSVGVEGVLTPELAGNNTNAAEVSYRFTLPAEAAPGIYPLRIATPTGVSNVKLICIDDLPSVAQTKPNSTMAQAQALTLPTAVDGYVDNLSRDYYKFTVAAGQKLSFEVLAQRLGTALDPLIRLFDATGKEITYADDTPGVGADCQLVHTFAAAGEYILEVRDIRYQGGGNHQYRLRIGDFPCVSVPYPMAVKKGTSGNVGFAGISGAEVNPVGLALPAELPTPFISVAGKGAGQNFSGWGYLAVSATDEPLEVEPNDAAEQATKVAIPSGLNGRFDKAGDVDRFTFTATKGQRFLFAGVTRAQFSPTDLVLKMLNAQGGEIANLDDTGTDEGVLDFNCPADGDYTLLVEDLHKRGGPEFAYRVVVKPFDQPLKLNVAAETLNVPAGGLIPVLVTAVRGPYTGPITLALAGAPEGLVATPVIMGPGRNSVTMTIRCDAAVPAGKFYPLQIVGKTVLNGAEITAVASLNDAYKAVLNGMPYPPGNLETTAVAGVTSAGLFTLSTATPEIVFGKDLSATVKVVVARKADFAEEIAIAVQPAQDGIPAGITAAVKPIPKAMNEVEIVFTAANAAPLGQFSAVLIGTGKKDNTTTVQPIPALTLTLKAPFELKTEIPNGKIAKGQTIKAKITAVRNPAYAGPITLTFANLPAKVTAAAAMIPAGANEVEVDLVAAADAAPADVKNVIVNGEGLNGAAKLPGAAPAVGLIVE
jgi:hypothetical protein